MTVYLLIICLPSLFHPYISFAADSTKSNKHTQIIHRNNWGFSILYSEKGTGVSSSYFCPVGKNTDLLFNLSFASISDNREFEQFDIFGNSYVRGKENSVYMIPFNISLQHYIFKDEIEGNFRPLITAGITPALILTNPYDKNFFAAWKYSKAAFAAGGFAGVGMEFLWEKKLAFTLNVKYYYLPVLKGTVNSLKNSPINDLGGIQLIFGVNFLK